MAIWARRFDYECLLTIMFAILPFFEAKRGLEFYAAMHKYSLSRESTPPRGLSKRSYDVTNQDTTHSTRAKGNVRILRQQEELPLLRDHLLRLDRVSRHDRFQGFIDDSFIERYAAKCAADGTVIIAYIEDGVVRGAAELHPPDQSPDALPEIAFSVEASVRRQGVGSILFRKLIAEARSKGYRSLRITTGAQNHAMRALANKFGAHLTFRHGESTGSIDLTQQPLPPFAGRAIATPIDAARATINVYRAYWQLYLRMYGLGRTAHRHAESASRHA
jgi:GNAT superfamily N-acetyltransferase